MRACGEMRLRQPGTNGYRGLRVNARLQQLSDLL